MRKSCHGLTYVGGSPLRRGNIDSARGIEQHVAVGHDSSLVWPRQPCNGIQQRGFAGSGRSKENRNAGRSFDRNIKDKRGGARAAPLFANSRGEDRRVYFAGHGVHTRRFTAYTTHNTENEIASSTSAMRLASPYSSDCTRS